MRSNTIWQLECTTRRHCCEHATENSRNTQFISLQDCAKVSRMTDLLHTGNPDTTCLYVFAHGAGAPMTSPWMDEFTNHLANANLSIIRFEFKYMAARRCGTRKPPPRADRLTGEFAAVIDDVIENHLRPNQKLVIGGKSMGGRVASLIAGDLFRDSRINGLACASYPFHPPGKPENLRTAHLEGLKCPTIIAQGERDPFGNKDETASYELSKKISLSWLPDGDHDLKPRRASGRTLSDNLQDAALAIAAHCFKVK